MASGATFRLEGSAALDKALAELPKSLAKGVLRRALTKASQPVLEAARQNVPVREGNLRDSLSISTRLVTSQQGDHTKSRGVEIFIGPAWPEGAHGHLVEFGTAHSAAEPFLRPAWDEYQQAVLTGVGEQVWTELEKTAKRLAKQAEAGKLSKSSRRHFTR